MSCRLRHHRLRLHDIVTLGATVVLLLCLQLSYSGGVTHVEGGRPAVTGVEVLSLPVSAPQPLALTGPRAFPKLTGLTDARQRPGQLVHAAVLALVEAAGLARGRVPAPATRTPLVCASGLLAVRAPPVPVA